MKTHPVVSALVVTVLLGVASSPSRAAMFSSLAITGDPAIGVPGETYQNLNRGFAAGPGIEGFVTGALGTTIWAGSPLQRIASTGEAAPDTSNGEQLRTVRGPVTNPAGLAAFGGFMQRGIGGVSTANDGGIWGGGPGAVELVARAGNAAPGGSLFFDRDLDFSPSLGVSGDLAFLSTLKDGPTSFNRVGVGVYTGTKATLRKVIQTGDAVVDKNGDPTGEVFQISSGERVQINASNTIVFEGGINTDGGSGNGGDVFGYWKDEAGVVKNVVRTGDATPGVPGETFAFGPSAFDEVTFNDNGDIAFFGNLSGPGFGLWAGPHESYGLVARDGDAAPGGGVFTGFDNLVMDGAGGVAFTARTTGFDNTGLFTNHGGFLEEVIAPGVPAPGVPGRKIGGVGGLAMNGIGQLIFDVNLEPIVEDPSGNDNGPFRALYLRDELGNLQRILTEGETVDVDGSPLLINDFSFLQGDTQDGRGYSLNDQSKFVFKVSFDDFSQSAILTTMVMAIPEPGTAVLVAVALGLMADPRRRV